MATPTAPLKALPRLVVKLKYPQGYKQVTETELDNLLKDIRQGVSGFVCTLQASYKPPQSFITSAVQYMIPNGDISVNYCNTTKGISLKHTILIEILTNAKSIPLKVLDLIQEKVRCRIVKGSSDIDVVRMVGVCQMSMTETPKLTGVETSTNSPSFVVRFQYPQCCVPVQQEALDKILCGMQKTEGLYNYECTLEASVSDLGMTSKLDSASVNQTQKYCKTAPVYSAGKDLSESNPLTPTILIEFLYTAKPASDDIDDIESAVISLVKENVIPKKFTQEVRVKLFHVNTAS